MVEQVDGVIQDGILRPPSDLPEPALTRNARIVLERRYLHRKDGGEPLETPAGAFWRVAREVARGSEPWETRAAIEQLERDYYTTMARLDFLPNSPTLMNAGKNNGLQYSACYVLPIPDSMEGIFETNKRAALIHQSGGGTGFAFSRLRPAGDLVGSTGGVASGPISFLEVYNGSTESVKQGGTRRGANMGILRVDHPDIMSFIRCKRDLNEHNQIAYDAVAGSLSPEKRSALKMALLESQISNFNISVGITNRFMEALERDEDFELISPRTGEVAGTLSARKVFQEMTECAWETGDPGVVFLDRINAGPANPVPDMGPIEATNPCGEQPLYPNEACNLGSLNLSNFVRAPVTNGHATNGHAANRTNNGHAIAPRQRIDWDRMERTVRLAIRFLDDVISVNPYPDRFIDDAVKANRRVGLGVMGWADLLIQLGIPYDSEDALELGEEMMRFINRVGHEESERLAAVRGPFPNWSKSIYKDGKPLRNSTVTTIAPTGTISIIAGCSSGIEPLFALVFDRKGSLDGQLTLEVNPVFDDIARREGFWTEELAEAVHEKGTVRGVAGMPDKWQQVFGTAHDIAPSWHVRMQGVWQKNTDNAVSKTINLPHDATVADVEAAYLLAYDTGCNGITVYRDGSKVGVLHVGSGSASDQAGATDDDEELAPRPRALAGMTYQIETPLGTAYITVNQDERGEPLEVFVNQGKAGSDIAPLSEAVGKLSTIILSVPSSMPRRERLRTIIRRLRGIGGSSSIGFGPDRTRSLPDALAKVLEQHLIALESREASTLTTLPVLAAASKPATNGKTLQLSGAFCPDCGTALVHEEGCDKCFTCGYSRC